MLPKRQKEVQTNDNTDYGECILTKYNEEKNKTERKEIMILQIFASATCHRVSNSVFDASNKFRFFIKACTTTVYKTV